MIRAEGLTRAASPHTPAITGLTLDVAAGDCVVVMGPPDAGASTLLGLLAAALRPASGTLRIAGADASTATVAVRRQTCWVGARRVRWEGTVGDYLHLLAAARAAGDGERVSRALARTSLDGARRVEALDAADAAALDVATVLVTDAPVALVDSPFEPPARLRTLWRETLSDARRDGRTIVFSASPDTDVPPIWDRLLTLDRGRVSDERAAPRPVLDTAWQVAHR